VRGAVRLRWLALLAALAGCVTAAPPEWREQNTVRGFVLRQSIEAGAGETFEVCLALENRGARSAYDFAGLRFRTTTIFYMSSGAIDPPDVPGHFSRVPPPYPSDLWNFTELPVGASVRECGTHRYDSAHVSVFVVQSSYDSALSDTAVFAEPIAAAIAAGTHDAPLNRAEATLYSNRCRVDRRRRQATCDASLAN
jgi:hypothetical protein